MQKLRFIVLLSAFLAISCSVVPSYEIPARPGYILAGVQPGDTVEVTTRDGKYRRFTVTSVDTAAITSANEFIPIEDIETIHKRSWSRPKHPCGGGEPVGCSVPLILLLDTEILDLAEDLEPQCTRHDFCYRHGFATYGSTREECDEEFYTGMRKACFGPLGLKVLDIRSFLGCQAEVAEIYNVVRQYGEDGFRKEDSTYCEYDLARTLHESPRRSD